MYCFGYAREGDKAIKRIVYFLGGILFDNVPLDVKDLAPQGPNEYSGVAFVMVVLVGDLGLAPENKLLLGEYHNPAAQERLLIAPGARACRALLGSHWQTNVYGRFREVEGLPTWHCDGLRGRVPVCEIHETFTAVGTPPCHESEFCFKIVDQRLLDNTKEPMPDPQIHDGCAVWTMEDIAKIYDCAGNFILDQWWYLLGCWCAA